jgi:hypothetical protein
MVYKVRLDLKAKMALQGLAGIEAKLVLKVKTELQVMTAQLAQVALQAQVVRMDWKVLLVPLAMTELQARLDKEV